MTELFFKRGSMDAEQTLLYVFSPSHQDRFYQMQMDLLTDRQSSINDHHLLVAEVFEQSGHIGSDDISDENCKGLRKQYNIQPEQFKVMLIGKDSAVKLETDSCVSCEELFMRMESEKYSVHQMVL